MAAKFPSLSSSSAGSHLGRDVAMGARPSRKLDRSLLSLTVRQLPHDPERVALVRALFSMTSALCMATTLEGVETTEQFRLAVDEGCRSFTTTSMANRLAVPVIRAYLSFRFAPRPRRRHKKTRRESHHSSLGFPANKRIDHQQALRREQMDTFSR